MKNIKIKNVILSALFLSASTANASVDTDQKISQIMDKYFPGGSGAVYRSQHDAVKHLFSKGIHNPSKAAVVAFASLRSLGTNFGLDSDMSNRLIKALEKNVIPKYIAIKDANQNDHHNNLCHLAYKLTSKGYQKQNLKQFYLRDSENHPHIELNRYFFVEDCVIDDGEVESDSVKNTF